MINITDATITLHERDPRRSFPPDYRTDFKPERVKFNVKYDPARNHFTVKADVAHFRLREGVRSAPMPTAFIVWGPDDSPIHIAPLEYGVPDTWTITRDDTIRVDVTMHTRGGLT